MVLNVQQDYIFLPIAPISWGRNTTDGRGVYEVHYGEGGMMTSVGNLSPLGLCKADRGFTDFGVP